MPKLRWGVLSTAKIGQEQVIPAIQRSSNGEVVAIASRKLKKAQEVQINGLSLKLMIAMMHC